MSLADLPGTDTAAPRRWLSIIGIGEEGIEGLSLSACRIIADADIVFGGKRHLGLAQPLIKGIAQPWPSPFERAVDEVIAQRHAQVCVLASGDPFLYGVGSLLARHIPPEQTIVIPAPSALSLAAARLGWALPETIVVSLHGRPLDLIRPHLQPGTNLLVLTADGQAPRAIAELLNTCGFGPSQCIVLEALGGKRERIRTARAATFDLTAIDPLNIMAIQVAADPDARIIARASGLPDILFEHDGQITKREIRALTLSALAPCRGQLLWDVGAGSGSVGIEWMLADPSLCAIAIETRNDRAARIRRNAMALGVPALEVVEDQAPRAFHSLATPDAIFVGGGVSEPGVLENAMTALRPRGRLVVNAVTLESEALLIAHHAALGGELIRIAISRAGPLATMKGWRPALAVTQWAWTKP